MGIGKGMNDGGEAWLKRFFMFSKTVTENGESLTGKHKRLKIIPASAATTFLNVYVPPMGARLLLAVSSTGLLPPPHRVARLNIFKLSNCTEGIPAPDMPPLFMAGIASRDANGVAGIGDGISPGIGYSSEFPVNRRTVMTKFNLPLI